MAYDADNRMKTAAGVSYTYDGDGKRVQKSNGKLYWYGISADVLVESDASGNVTDEFVFFGGRRIARRDPSGNVFYYFADHLGSSRVIVQQGQTQPCYEGDYYPFGGERVVTNTCPQSYKFTGKERDTESGLDDFGPRYYSSGYGRFMSPDALLGFLTNPQSLNRYTYVMNNPLRLIDPSGFTAEESSASSNGQPQTGQSECDSAHVDCATPGGSAQPVGQQAQQNQAKDKEEVVKELTALAEEFGVPVEAVLAVAATESGTNPNAKPNLNYKKDENGNYVLDDKGNRIVESTDYGLMQVNSKNIGVSFTVGGTTVAIGENVKTDWKANARAGVALYADEFNAAKRQIPQASTQEQAQRAYSGYNAGRPDNDRYARTGKGYPDTRDTNFLINYQKLREKP